MMGPTMEVTRLEIALCGVVLVAVAVLIVRSGQALRRKARAWEKAAQVMHTYSHLLASTTTEDGLAIRPRDQQLLMSAETALGWLVRLTGYRSDQVRAVQVGGWWILESKQAAADQVK